MLTGAIDMLTSTRNMLTCAGQLIKLVRRSGVNFTGGPGVLK
jgi:hypothetical protein